MVLVVIAGLLWFSAGLLSDYNVMLAEKLNKLYRKYDYPKIRSRKKLFYKRKIIFNSRVVRVLAVTSILTLIIGFITY